MMRSDDLERARFSPQTRSVAKPFVYRTVFRKNRKIENPLLPALCRTVITRISIARKDHQRHWTERRSEAKATATLALALLRYCAKKSMCNQMVSTIMTIHAPTHTTRCSPSLRQFFRRFGWADRRKTEDSRPPFRTPVRPTPTSRPLCCSPVNNE